MPFDQPLSDDDIRRVAPSVFATHPATNVSERYAYLPTYSVLRQLQTIGLDVVKVRQGFKRSPEGKDFAIHELRLRQRGYVSKTPELGDLVPEVILRNSHDRTSGFDFTAGITRLVCLNGLTVSDQAFGFKARHTGRSALGTVTEGVFDIVGKFGQIIEKAGTWARVALTQPQRVEFARKALEVRGTSLAVEPEHLLRPRRYGDGAANLWTTYNVVQENLTRGGLPARNAVNDRRTLGGVRTLIADVDLNRKLWATAEEFATQAA